MMNVAATTRKLGDMVIRRNRLHKPVREIAERPEQRDRWFFERKVFRQARESGATRCAIGVLRIEFIEAACGFYEGSTTTEITVCRALEAEGLSVQCSVKTFRKRNRGLNVLTEH